MARQPSPSHYDERWARFLAESLLETLPQRVRHSESVAAAGKAAAHVVPLDQADALVAAAWLHDIGYSLALAQSGFHPLDGAVYLAAEGAPATVVSLVAHHSCSRFEARERGLLHELGRFPEPPADLADALIYADMTTGPTGETVTVDERIAEILTRYPDDDPVHRAIAAAAMELRAAVARVQERLPGSDQPM